MTVLFVSNFARDGHLLPVALELLRRDVAVYVFNPGDFPGSATLTTESSGAGPRTVLDWNGARLDLAEVRSVWYRRPERFVLPDTLLPDEETWLRGECTNFVQGIWANTDALWVSDPLQLRRASYKVVQLRVAAAIGFAVPPYLITNDPARARDFIEQHPEGVVVKALSTPAVTTDGAGASMVYTHLLTPEDMEYLDSVRHGPTQFQAFVRKVRDIRVTVIGENVFAVSLESADIPDAWTDFRRTKIWDIPHVPFDLPAPVEAACRELVRCLGLRFGAIDLLQTEDGAYVFLEINPNGQWLWLEEMTGLPMSVAMADLLEAGLHGRPSRPREPARRRRVTLPVGAQRVAVPQGLALDGATRDGGRLDLAATRAWLEKRQSRLLLHIGDVEPAEPDGEDAHDA